MIKETLISIIIILVFTDFSLSQTTSSYPLSVPSSGMSQIQKSRTIEESVPLEQPIDPDTYIVGPSDKVEISIWGEVNLSYPLTVNPDGTILVPPTGEIKVSDMTLSEARKVVKEKLHKHYRNVDITLNLIALRKFKVFVLGNVVYPGTYIATPVDRVSDIIDKSNQSKDKGEPLIAKETIRTVHLTYKDGKTESIDLLLFYLKGDMTHNPTLAEGEIIFVPFNRKFVSILGDIKHQSGHHEIKEKETLNDIINLSGGFTSYAYTKRIEVTRIEANQFRRIFFVDFDIADSLNRYLPLKDGDYIVVPSIFSIHPRVYIKGAVYGSGQQSIRVFEQAGIVEKESSGIYEMREGETALDLIQRAGGVTPWADLPNAYIERKMDEGSKEKKIIKLDLYKILVEKDYSYNVPLKNGDLIIVPPAEELVYVTGAVSKPGIYPYRPHLTVRDYVGLAGGISDKGKASGWKIISTEGKKYRADETQTLNKEDTIFVPTRVLVNFNEIVVPIAGVASMVISTMVLFTK